MITLYQLPAGADGLSLSASSNKVHYALRLKRLPYRAESVLLPSRRVSATGALPVLDWHGERIGDSTAILRFLDDRAPEVPLVPASTAEAGRGWFLAEWANTVLHPTVAHVRYSNPAVRAQIGSEMVPALPRWLARFAAEPSRRSLARWSRALGKRGPNWAGRAVEQALDAVDAIAAEGEWLVSRSPSIADICVAAPLHLFLRDQAPEPLSWLQARPHARAWLLRFLGRVEAGQRATSNRSEIP